jgi:hypothetical protein
LGGVCHAESAERLFFHQATSLWTQDQMLSQKLLLDVGVDTFTGENSYRQHKSTAHSAFNASFHSMAITSGPGRHLVAFST